MEGINWWAVLLFGVCMLVALVCLVLSFVAAGFWLARRSQGSLHSFAAALMCGFVSTAIMAPAMQICEHPGHPTVLTVFVCLGLILVGVNQYFKVRSPQSYAIALGCAAGFTALGAATLHIWDTSLFPGPHIVVFISVLLALVGLTVEVLSSSPVRGRSQMRILLMLGLVNLTVFIAAVMSSERDSGILLDDDKLSEFAINTNWSVVFSALAVSVLICVGLFLCLGKSRNCVQQSRDT